jgi:cyclopropane-fatty-acyl-phospholipid synthase
MGLSLKSLFGDVPAHLSDGLLDKLFADYPRRDFQIRLWDGSRWGADEPPRFTLVLRHPEALRRMFLDPSELAIGEAYIYDDFDVEGDIEAAFDLSDYLLGQQRSLGKSSTMARWLRKLPRGRGQRTGPHLVKPQGPVSSKDYDRQAISYHYDLPFEFYSLWLDRRMVYSCAYFATAEEDLETAQERKLDYICRKLRLRPGDRLLDIGCGWGALLMHAAAHYGAQAVGITLSVPQAEMARQRIREAGRNAQCRVEVCDYRDFESSEPYDKIVSVGMFEHVEEGHLPQYFTRAWNLLRAGGVFLNHGISYSATYQRQGPSFTDRYVFPNGNLVPLSTSLQVAELSGFEVRDVESLREHYALTLRHWLKRLEAHSEEAHRITTDTNYRIRRLHLAGSAHAFRNGRLNLYQALLAKPLRGQAGLPLTRQDWYRD